MTNYEYTCQNCGTEKIVKKPASMFHRVHSLFMEHGEYRRFSKGFVHFEIALAVEILLQMPAGSIYLLSSKAKLL